MIEYDLVAARLAEYLTSEYSRSKLEMRAPYVFIYMSMYADVLVGRAGCLKWKMPSLLQRDEESQHEVPASSAADRCQDKVR